MNFVKQVVKWLEDRKIFWRKRKNNKQRALGMLLYHAGLSYEKSGELPVPKERAKKGSKLDAFKDYIVNKLQEGPFTASRLLREIQEMGFTGKYTIVKDFIREIRPEQSVQAVYSYETRPGVQAQVVWSELDVHGKTYHISN